jgi:hypothetical protein
MDDVKCPANSGALSVALRAIIRIMKNKKNLKAHRIIQDEKV